MAGKFTIEAIFKATDRFSGVLGAIEARAGRFSRNLGGAFKDVGAMADRFASGLKQIAIGAAAVGAIAGAGLLKVGEAGAHFEQSITNVGAVMGKNRAQIVDLEKEAMRLGVVTQFSASEVSEAMESMARKGFDAEEILQGIPGVLDAIAASGEGMAEVSTVVGSTIRGFGLDASKAAHVADILAFSAEKSGAHITDMGTALATAAPTAKALGVSLEDTAAAVGLLQKMGLDASTAGSATATMLAKISKPSADAAKQMAALGVSFKDAKGNALPFRDILGQFVKVGDKAGGNMNRMAFFAELVGLRGDKAALALADMAKTGDFDKLTESLKNVDGYAHKVATIRLDTTTGSWKLLTSTVEVLETKLFELKSGPLRGVIDGTNQWLQANQELIVSGVKDYIEKAAFGIDMFTHGVKDGFGALKEGIGGVEGPLGRVAKLFDLFPSWPVAIRDIGFALGTVGPVLLTVAAGAKAVSFAMGTLNAVLDANPYTLVLMALVGLGTAFIVYRSEITAFAERHKFLLGILAGGLTIWAGVYMWTNAWKGALIALEIAQGAATAATWLANGARGALALATRAAAVAETLFTGQITASAVATDGAAASMVAAEASMGALLVTLGAATAAVGALVAVWYEWQGLEQASGGHVWEGVKGVFNGKGFFGAIDEAENEDARKKFAAEHPGTPLPGAAADGANPPPQLVGPEGIAKSVVETKEVHEEKVQVELKLPPGVTADVKTPQAGSKVPVKTTPSGGFRGPRK
jgi:TP901 family phage tail tape measure protein